MRSNWLTFVGAGSLGLMTALGPVNGKLARAADDRPSTILGDTSERQQALDLLRQATAALRAKRLDVARRLALQAQDLNATYSLFDVRPEHILAEVERREQSGCATAKPATAAAPQAAPAPKPISALAGAGAESADPFAQPIDRGPAAMPAPAVTATPTPTTVAAVPAPADQTAGTLAVIKQAPRPQSAPGLTAEQLRARAIEMLDRGLQALDEHRLDEADRYARAALALQAPFTKLEYKPEYLITEIGIARARLRLDAMTSSATPSEQSLRHQQQQVLPSPQSQPAPLSQQAESLPRAVRQPYQTQPQWQSPVPAQQSSAIVTASASASASTTSVLPVPTAPVPAAPVAAALVPLVTATAHAAPVASIAVNAQKGAASVRDRAERMLQEAVVDLHAGRDDVARARIQAALSAIYPPGTRPLPIFSSETPITAAGPRLEAPQPGMPRAGFPSYTQANLPSMKDSVLKPLHDPYLGDDATTTAKSSATENTLRENNPEFTPMNSSLSLDRPLPKMSDELPQPAAPAIVASRAAAASPIQTQSASDAQAQAAPVRWPQSGTSASGTATLPAAAPVPAAVAPGAAPPQTNRLVIAPYTPPGGDPMSPSSSDSPRPGFFDRVWTAISGERD